MSFGEVITPCSPVMAALYNKGIMTISNLLNAESAIIGFTASIFFAIGTLKISGEDIKNASETRWNLNAYIAILMIRQKADYILGSLFLCIAFLSQVLYALILPSTLLSSPVSAKSTLVVLVLSLVLILCVSYCSHLISNQIVERQVIKKLKPKDAEHLLSKLSQR